MFEPKIPLVSEIMCSLRFAHNNHVLDAYAEAAILVVSRFYEEVDTSAMLCYERVRQKAGVPFETVIPTFNAVAL